MHNLAIFHALASSPIRVVTVRHEQTTVYAADGYARATGRLGVAITTTGPGAANAAAAMGEARASRSPVLHLSTQIESRLLEARGGRFSLHESPHQRALMDAVGVWSATVARAEAIPSLVLRAAREAFAGRRGPAFLEIPTDLLDEPVRWKAQDPLRARAFLPEPETLRRAADVLAEAKRPVIWAGGGAVSSGAGEVLAKVAETIQAPVVTTFAGKGLLPADHPLAVGFPPHQPEVTKLIGASDALLVVGSDLDGMNTQGWRLPMPRPRVGINTVAEDLRRNYSCDVVIEADARETLEALLPMLKPRRGEPGARRVAKVRADADASLRASKGLAPGYRFAQALQKAIPPDAFVVADMAIPGYWAAGYWRAQTPRSFAYPLGWGTLGFALPAAIGVAAAGRRAVAVCGDAGALFAIGELATAVQESLPVVALVVDDGGYGMLRFDEEERFGRSVASDLRSPDFAAVARAFGAHAATASRADLEGTLRWALSRNEPAVVVLKTTMEPPLTTSPRWPLKGKPEARP